MYSFMNIILKLFIQLNVCPMKCIQTLSLVWGYSTAVPRNYKLHIIVATQVSVIEIRQAYKNDS